MTAGFRHVSQRRLVAYSAALALVGSGVVLGVVPALAAPTCVVNSNGDAGAQDATTGCDSTLGAGKVTLRSALERSNSLGGSNTISFSGPFTITIASGLVSDNGSVTITGAGVDQTIVDAQHNSKIFDSAHNITISAITLKNGKSTNTGTAVFSGNTTLTATSVKITGTVVDNSSVSGGVVGGSTTATFTSSLIDGTTVTSTDGDISGAVSNTNSVTYTDTIVSNTTMNPCQGCSVDGVIRGGTVNLTRSAVVGTTTNLGSSDTVNGGVVDSSGGVTLDHSAIGNYTLNAATNSTINGGVVQAEGVSILDSTIGHTGQTATTGTTVNGSIVETAALTMTNATVADNSITVGANSTNSSGSFRAQSATLKNTIVSRNLPANCATAFGSSDHSLDSDGTCGMGSANGNKSNQDPGLGAFQVNSPGLTPTMAITATSPAYNSANNANCPATDQRGVARISAGDATCDMGAYEFVAAATTPSPSPTPALPKAGAASTPAAPLRALLLTVLLALLGGVVALARQGLSGWRVDTR